MPGAASADDASVAGSGRMAPLLAALAERANPLTVRLVRQQLRSTAFVVGFCVLLALCTVTALLIASLGRGLTGGAGHRLFILVAGCWALIAWMLIPSLIGQALARERQEQTWDLVNLTGLPPRRIITGLLAAAMVQQAVVAAAVAPFLVMAWLLRGLDVALVALALVAVPAGGGLASALSLSSGSALKLPKQRSTSAVPIVLGVLVLAGIVLPTLAAIRVPLDSMLIGALYAGEPWAWGGLLMAANAVALGVVVAVVHATANLAHPAEDRSSARQAMALVSWLNAFAWCLAWGWISGRWSQCLATAALLGVIRATMLGLMGVSEHWLLTRRQQRSMAALPRWRRLVMGPGAARGRFVYLALTSASLAAAGLAMAVDGYGWERLISRPLAGGVLAVAAYVAAFLFAGDLLARALMRRGRHLPMLQRGLTIALAAAATTASFVTLAALDLNFRQTGIGPLTLINPVWGTMLISEAAWWKGWPVFAAGLLAAVGLLAQALRARPGIRMLRPEEL
jgi:hypothetical protein